MHTFIRFRATSAGATRAVVLRFATLAVAVFAAACGSRGAPVPDLTGDASEVITLAALDGGGEATTQPLMLDSISFGRLGTLIGNAPFTAAELDSRVRRDVLLVDPEDVLECPSREPCRLRAGSTYVTLWDAALAGDILSVTVSRVRNVERLYTMTEHQTRLLQLRRTGTGWRLIATEPII
ncbi:hypothetical protein BH23GEM10_BH23GEM10_02170 [soil metagenome]